jgi:hypothetical protein
MNAETRQAPILARVKTEIFYAVLFTIITLVIAAGMLYFLPVFQGYMKNVNPELIHARTYQLQQDGGAILYAPASGDEPSRDALDRYREDLEILARRFERGNFEMASLSGLRNSEVVQAVLKNRENYSYDVETQAEAAVLNIKSDGKAATEALHAYLRFLEKHWVFKP